MKSTELIFGEGTTGERVRRVEESEECLVPDTIFLTHGNDLLEVETALAIIEALLHEVYQ